MRTGSGHRSGEDAGGEAGEENGEDVELHYFLLPRARRGCFLLVGLCNVVGRGGGRT